MNPPSATPRTDAAVQAALETTAPCQGGMVWASFARTLERELNAALLKAEGYRLDAKFDPLILRQKSEELSASRAREAKLREVLFRLKNEGLDENGWFYAGVDHLRSVVDAVLSETSSAPPDHE